MTGPFWFCREAGPVGGQRHIRDPGSGGETIAVPAQASRQIRYEGVSHSLVLREVLRGEGNQKTSGQDGTAQSW